MKKLFKLMLALLLAAGIAGCSTKKVADTEETTEETTEDTSEETNEEEPQETADETQTEETSDVADEVQDAFNGCLDAIYNIQPGSAGTSLREEEAADTLKTFLETYDLTEADYANMTLYYIENNEVDNARLLESINDLKDSNLLSDEANFDTFYNGSIGNLQA